jgi:pyridoxal phosphate enzyme (YggS family)
MLTGPQFSTSRLDEVRQKIAAAAIRAGRSPESVTLVGVSKTYPAEIVAAARQSGLCDFGENYLQEAIDKIGRLPREGIIWHFIGHLQSNKTRPVAELFDWVHTVDRLKVAERLSAQRPFHGPELQVCLQVKLAPEETKSGVDPAELPELARAVEALPRLRLRGLMCMPPPSADPAVQRGYFSRLRELRDALNRDGLNLDVLSMGMSGDFETAILEGATHVRVGSAIFGARERAI